MAKAIRGHNLGTRLAMVLLAALLLLIASAFVVWQATTTGEGVGTPAISADHDGDSRFVRDPSIERHAAVVASYRNQADAPATSQDGTGGSRLIRDPSVERHAEVVARYNQGDLR